VNQHLSIDGLEDRVIDEVYANHIPLPIIGERGVPNIVVAFDYEPLSVLLNRIGNIGGYANDSY